MPDENRVFDVTRPSKVSPMATSKPVIAGHMPMTSDPMVKEQGDSVSLGDSMGSKIHITDGDQQSDHLDMANGIMENGHTEPAPEPVPIKMPDAASEQPKVEEPKQPAVFDNPPAESPEDPMHSTNQEPSSEFKPTDSSEPEPENEEDDDSDKPIPHVQGISVVGPKPRRWPKIVLLIILLLVVGAYLFIDSGVVDTGINLPFHIFKQKQKTPTVSVSKTPPAAPAATPALPQGFKQYNLAGTPISFAAPTDWGDATSSTEQGYSIRGGSNQTAGTYAYIVNFPNNKDVQLVVTSDKYLPPARSALYYDFLNWCVGSSDNKYYQATLKFTTTNKVDTPTTVTCDQGPLLNPTKIDSSTIVVSKATDSTNAIIGDIYTKNLTDPNLVVFRTKDTAMTNGDNIKLLLKSVKLSSNQSQ